MTKIEIDFFELSFLAEACIPPVPIARGSFWNRLINEVYYKLSSDERERLFGWITKNCKFDLENEDCAWFYARYNPKNQFDVQSFHNGEAGVHEAFLKDDKYHTAINRFISPEYIKRVVRVFDNLEIKNK